MTLSLTLNLSTNEITVYLLEKETHNDNKNLQSNNG